MNSRVRRWRIGVWTPATEFFNDVAELFPSRFSSKHEPVPEAQEFVSKMETLRHLSRNPQIPMKRERECVCVRARARSFGDVPVGNGREDTGGDHCVKQSKGLLHFFRFRFGALCSYFKASSFLMFQTHPSKFPHFISLSL